MMCIVWMAQTVFSSVLKVFTANPIKSKSNVSNQGQVILIEVSSELWVQQACERE
jgi:hypothetical protein